MSGASRSMRGVGFALLTTLLLLSLNTLLAGASGDSPNLSQSPVWQKSLPSSPCPGSSDTNCHRASPVLADLNDDDKLEVIVATNRGHVLAYRHDGKLLWDRDVAPSSGMSKNSQRIAASPAVADIDADGRPEIVVGMGTVYRDVCTQGGVIVLEDNGAVKRGWPFLTTDFAIPPKGCRDTVFSTPALGDLDKDGDMEVVFGSFDKRIYALSHKGTLMPGFPADSYHYARFGWDNLNNRLADTIWSSPTLADLDKDGYLDIIIGTDEGNYDTSWSPVVGNWQCPYRKDAPKGYCGGSIYAVNRFGRILSNFPLYKLEIIQSTAAAYDVDGDHRSEFFVGSGDYYYITSPDKPSYGFLFYGIDDNGRALPGWKGGKRLGGIVTSSPALGDLDRDGEPEIVIPARDKKLYAFHVDGSNVDGFPMTPRTRYGQVFGDFRTGLSPLLGDYTGDGKMEIFLRTGWEVVVIDGKGQQLTADGTSGSKPAYPTDGPLWNTPAIGDLDGDGQLELVVQNSELLVWSLPGSSSLTDWPMFKHDAARTSYKEPIGPEFEYNPSVMQFFKEKRDKLNFYQPITLRSLRGSFDFELKTNNSDAIRIAEKSGTINDEEIIDVRVIAMDDLGLGVNRLGAINLKLSRNGIVYANETIPVEVNVMRRLHQSFLPLLH